MRTGLTRLAVAAVLLASIWATAGCGASSRRFGPVQTHPSPVIHTAGRSFSRIAVLVMENEEYGDLIGSRSTPYINSLARHYALATRSFAITHPSLPNYLALTGGRTFGISSDCTDCSVSAAGLPGQLQRAGVSWRAYMEGLPHSCYGGADSGEYAKKHDPFMYFIPIARSAACRHVVPLTQLNHDLHGSGLPRFLWITPNLCHDMHDCSPATGDRFLARLLPGLLRALGPHGLLFLTWDEGSSDEGCCRLASGGHVVTIVAGGGARRGVRLSRPVDHYSILQAIDDLLHLPRLGNAACACTPSLSPLLELGRVSRR